MLGELAALERGRRGRQAVKGELDERAAGVVLPTGAHRRTAGTDALMDVLILRRRERVSCPRLG